MNLSESIKQKAIESGFDLVGITDASRIDQVHVEFLQRWLADSFAGEMDYMHRNFKKRINPAELHKNAKSVICVALNYTPPKTQRSSNVPTGQIANYARYEDYHSFIKKQLRKLTDFLTAATDSDVRCKICVDSVPVAERALAQRAGLGFIGKNHMLINPELGSQLFLAEVITTLKLKSDKPIKGKCTDCDKCISACPTGALKPDGRFDVRKCISYLTIEYKGEIAPESAERIGDRLFGCDECVLACPYQKNAPVCKNNEFKFYSDRAELDLQDILNLTEEMFQLRFADSPVKRLGLQRLKRNAQICLANIYQL